jgi:hypothetical protein
MPFPTKPVLTLPGLLLLAGPALAQGWGAIPTRPVSHVPAETPLGCATVVERRDMVVIECPSGVRYVVHRCFPMCTPYPMAASSMETRREQREAVERRWVPAREASRERGW